MDMKWLMGWIAWCVILVVLAFLMHAIGVYSIFAWAYWYVAVAILALVMHYLMPLKFADA